MGKHLGIVFTGGEGPQPRRLKRLMGDLPDEALFVAADSGLLLAEAAGFRPDWIIGDMDSLAGAQSLNGGERLRSYPAERVIRHATDKDYSDTELALALLWDKGCDEAWIVGGGGGRLDQLLAIRDLFERAQFPRRWISAAEDIHCIAGEILTLALEPGTLVSVFPLGAASWKAESTGLQWPLGNVHWERGLYSLSNIALAAEITINAQQGRFMIIVEEKCRHK